MGFEKHLFISYAHLDNRPVSDKMKGWVSRFHDSLEPWLTIRLGRPAVIWRDHKLHGTDVFADEIVDQFPKVAVLLCILSPRYLESEWCAKEVSKFCEVAQTTSSLVVANKSRIVTLIKAPFEQGHPLPNAMTSVLGYQFYELDEDGTPLELDPDLFGPELAQKFNKKVAKLAWELKSALDLLEVAGEAVPAQGAPAPSKKPAVYLAECAYDQRDARDTLEAELRCHGYRVLPEQQLSRNEAKYVEEVSRLIEQCRLSVHLVGSQYGPVPDGPTDKSVVVLQNEIAARRSKEGGLRRIIWLPDGVQPRQEEQKAFVLELQKNSDVQYGADLITSNEAETIKNAIHMTLTRIQAPPATVLEREDETEKLIYLICDQRDRQNTIPLRVFLRNHGFEVKLPVFEGDAATVRLANEALLGESTAVILFYGEGSEAWKRSVEREVKKVRFRGTAHVSVWTYLASPETDDKRDLIEVREPQHFNCLKGFAEEVLLPFLQQFEASPR